MEGLLTPTTIWNPNFNKTIGRDFILNLHSWIRADDERIINAMKVDERIVIAALQKVWNGYLDGTNTVQITYDLAKLVLQSTSALTEHFTHCSISASIVFPKPPYQKEVDQDYCKLLIARKQVKRLWIMEVAIQICSANYESVCKVFLEGNFCSRILQKNSWSNLYPNGLDFYYPNFDEQLMSEKLHREFPLVEDKDNLLLDLAKVRELCAVVFKNEHAFDFRKMTKELKEDLSILEEILCLFLYRHGFLNMYTEVEEQNPLKGSLHEMVLHVKVMSYLLTSAFAQQEFESRLQESLLYFQANLHCVDRPKSLKYWFDFDLFDPIGKW